MKSHTQVVGRPIKIYQCARGGRIIIHITHESYTQMCNLFIGAAGRRARERTMTIDTRCWVTRFTSPPSISGNFIDHDETVSSCETVNASYVEYILIFFLIIITIDTTAIPNVWISILRKIEGLIFSNILNHRVSEFGPHYNDSALVNQNDHKQTQISQTQIQGYLSKFCNEKSYLHLDIKNFEVNQISLPRIS